MIITKITFNENNADRTYISYVDNKDDYIVSDGEIRILGEEKHITLNTEVYYKFHFNVLDELDEENFKDIINTNSALIAKNKAFKMLERRLRTEKEVVDGLKKNEFEDSVIDSTLNTLKEYNLINDEDYSRRYIKDKASSKGRLKILQELTRKGIDKETVLNQLDDSFFDEEYDAALNHCSKKYKSLKARETDERKIKEKIYRFLLSKGYEFDLAKRVLRQVIEDFDIDE